MATQILESISMAEKERTLYEAQWLFELDQQSELISAERRGKRDVAKKLKMQNVPLDIIHTSTELPMEELIAL